MNQSFRQNPLVRMLSSLKLMIVLLVAFAFATGGATLIEAAQGTPAARALVYDALWFELLITLLVLNLIFQLFYRMPYHLSQVGFVILHISIIVILVSAGITRFFGYEGMMSIREGKSTDYIYSSEQYVQLRRGEEEGYLEAALYKAGPQRVRGKIELGGESYRVKVEEYWPHCEESLVADPAGSPALHFAAVSEGNPQRLDLFAGESRRAGKVDFTFLEEAFGPAAEQRPFGQVDLHYGDAHASLPVGKTGGLSVSVGELTVTLHEFHPDYARRNDVPEPESMANPMVVVEISGPGADTASRSLFAFYPDLSISHGDDEEAFGDLHMTYRFSQGIELSLGAQGELLARSSFPIEVLNMMDQNVQQNYAEGEVFELVTRMLYRSGDFTLVPLEYLAAASYQPALSDNEMAPPALRVAVTAPNGERSTAFVNRGDQNRFVEFGGDRIGVGFGPRIINLPYRLHLDDFLLLTYPGSNNPASYESHVRLYDGERGEDGREVRIYMNHPLTHRGFKHFQSSYDPDHQGTVLSVNHDPGKWPTYFGYALLTLGFLVLMLKPLLWPKGGRPTRSEA